MKKALVVGINDYAPAGPGGPDLGGCINDARDMALTLNGLGIVPATPQNMKILLNANATRANILTGLTWLVTGAKAGDTLVFYYSGHGSWVVDTSGDEADHRDEAICPHDFQAAGMIIDDQLRALFTRLPAGATLEVILDSCFSGTATRLAPTSPNEQGFTPRFVEPAEEHQIYAEANPVISWKRILRPARGEKVVVIVPGLNHVLWAASANNQTSGEGPIGGVVRGYFTYCFCNNLRATHAAASRAWLDGIVRNCIRQFTLSQTPQLEASAGEVLQQPFK